ncbi:hypothetical protein KAFR_0A03450 [Kazachstania africana CBS 2517]|uniref:ATP-dependent RNA helicase n=1 Tax=Kazachstania africana (strain ATCC 22294 / BCRC 22015 / CBS 2517 / CECT 1963 / NBRC 1671 / NRRL Y-8276) TaxID=1071382 RepID=H2AN30_KAZAF|nr:hypothetical protein KAFR_0A03450 [Kazachstania africana CBS 2517]CCF55780.1 hypothetical protein KAFR_0A03450 [Kazachstania africana CBS 2517]
MSDNDGMILNFTTSDESGSNATKRSNKITGGRWKDRRKLRMAMDDKKTDRKRSHEETENRGNSSRITADLSDMPNKRKNTPSSNRGTKFQSTGTNDELPKTQALVQSNLPPSSQVVSSLFTSNRQIETSVNSNAQNEDTVVTASNAPLLDDSFESLGIKEPILSHLIEKMRIKKPTSIQKLAVPNLSSKGSDNDLFIHSQTGSGKTLSYLLPIFSSILNMNERVDRKSGCFALIIAPTRELASQIYHVASTLANCCHYLVPCLLIGGERKKSEKARLRKGCNFIIGTPGRILDHLQNTKVIREQLAATLRYVVLDEGDKLMELGFEETVRQIMEIIHSVDLDTKMYPALPHRIIRVLCSATINDVVSKLGKVALKNNKLISNSNTKGSSEKEETTQVAPDQLLQKITIVPPKLRLVTLGATLINITKKDLTRNHKKLLRTMVFLSCSDSVDFHYEAFSSTDSNYRNLVGDTVRLLTKGNGTLPNAGEDQDPNIICYKLHGSLSQQIRTSTLKHFATDNEATNGKHLIMFCTDVASRGLDLPYVGTVIEMDPPFSVDDHLHRIGRTARAGKSGESLLFLLPGEEEGYMDYIRKYHPMGWKLLKFDEDILKPSFSNMKVDRNDLGDKNNNKASLEWDTNATTWHLNIERHVLEDSSFKDLAMKGYSSHIRAYATHVSVEKQFFNVKYVHLGHLAKSFALRERPKAMGLNASKQQNSENRPSKENSKNKMWRIARMAVRESASEFNY